MRIKLMTLCMALCCLCINSFAQNVPDYVPTEGLVAWYPFNGNANDESGNGFHGNSIGATLTNDRFDTENSAYFFDWSDVTGYGTAWDRIELSPSFSDVIATTMTIDAWVNLENYWWPSNSIHTAMIAVSAARCSDGMNFRFKVKDEGRLALDFGTNSVTTEEGAIQLNTWYHVAATVSSDSLRLFINGTQVASSTSSSLDMTGCLTVGEHHQGNGHWYYWDGIIDEVGIWDRALTASEVLALHNAELPVPGCTDPTACNFNEEANEDDGSCVYPPSESVDCEFGGNYCGEGTIWNASLQACVGFNDCPSDLDGDGIVGVNDLLSLLSDFGTECPPDVAEWTCGDPVNYHGYDYATVQIGEQCWFAENLRTLQYTNGEALASIQGASNWEESTIGSVCSHGNNPAHEEVFGLLYNWYATSDDRGLCPNNWHLPGDAEWIQMELFLGMNETDAYQTGYRGSDQGSQLKNSIDDSPSWDGTNQTGFSAIGSGVRSPNGSFDALTMSGFYWLGSTSPELPWVRSLSFGYPYIVRSSSLDIGYGLSIRCIKDSE